MLNLSTLRLSLRRAASAQVMREAHAGARSIVAGTDGRTPYRVALSSALASAWSRPRRASLSRLRFEAEAWARVAVHAGTRFNVERKAVESFTFSVRSGVASLCVPSKVAGIASRQDAAAAVAARMDATGGRWVAGTYGTDGVGDLVALGLTLGTVQTKHSAWIAEAGAEAGGVRFAAIAATGGQRIGPDGMRATRGVNICLEVGDAVSRWVYGSAAMWACPDMVPVELPPVATPTAPTFASEDAEMRYLFG